MAKKTQAEIEFKILNAEFNRGMREMSTEMKTLNSDLKLNETQFKSTGDKAEFLKTKNNLLAKEYELSNQKVTDTTKAYEKAKEVFGENSKEAQTLKVKLNAASIEMYDLKKKTEEAHKTLSNFNKVSDGLDKMSEKSKKLASNLKGVSVAAAGISAASIAAYKTVDAGHDEIAKKTGATGESLKELDTIYKKIGSSVGTNLKTVGEGLGEVNTRFGFTNDALEQSTRKFLRFASVNNMDVTESVRLVSRAMGDASIPADEYEAVLDALTVASQKSGVTIESLTTNLSKYGAPMRALGMDMKDSIALFSQWEKAGVTTEIAFSGLKKAISNWGAAGKDARIEFSKTLEEIKACPDIASATSKAIDIFGQKAGPDLADAIQGGRFSVEEFTAALENSEGALDATAAATKDGGNTMAAAWNSLTISGSELGGIMLDTMAPAFQDLADFVKGLSNWFSELDDDQKSMIGTVILVSGSLSGLCLGLSGVLHIGSSVVSGITKLGGVFTFFTSPAGMVVLAIAAIIAIGVLLYQNWEEISAFCEETWTKIKNKFQEFDTWLTEIFKTDWTENFGVFGNVINSFFATLKDAWNACKDVFSGIVDFVAGIFTGDWERAWNGVVSIFKGIFGSIATFVKAPLNGLIGLINSAIDGINSIKVDIPSWVPFVGGEHFGLDFGHISYLWKGGVVNSPTLSMVGEGRDSEAVIPLNKKSVQPLADLIMDDIGQMQSGSIQNTIIAALEKATFLIDASMDGTPIITKINRVQALNMKGRR